MRSQFKRLAKAFETANSKINQLEAELTDLKSLIIGNETITDSIRDKKLRDNYATDELKPNKYLYELSNRVFKIEDKLLAKNYAASCQQLKERGETKNGNYKIQPSTKTQPFNVTCVFRSSSKDIR